MGTKEIPNMNRLVDQIEGVIPFHKDTYHFRDRDYWIDKGRNNQDTFPLFAIVREEFYHGPLREPDSDKLIKKVNTHFTSIKSAFLYAESLHYHTRDELGTRYVSISIMRKLTPQEELELIRHQEAIRQRSMSPFAKSLDKALQESAGGLL